MENKSMLVTYQRRRRSSLLPPTDFHTTLCSEAKGKGKIKEESVEDENPGEGFQEKGEYNQAVGSLKKRVQVFHFRRRRRVKYSDIFGSSDSDEVSSSIGSHSQATRICGPDSLLRQKISDAVFHHCLENIWNEGPEEKRNATMFFESNIFYMHTVKDFREIALEWSEQTVNDVFLKRYVLVPGFQWEHWTLLILCHFGEEIGSETKTPCVLMLDPLHEYGSPPELEPKIKEFVLDIFKLANRPESPEEIAKIPVLVPKVPQQQNGVECGVYSLFYADRFLENAPENFSVPNGYPYFMTGDWFDRDEVEEFYDRLEGFDPKDE